jgi:hypothetical protein
VGSVNPLGVTPTFVQPVFASAASSNEYYLQEIDATDRIERFIPGVEDDEVVSPYDGQTPLAITGQYAVYAFDPGNGADILYGHRSELSYYLRDQIDRWQHHPILMLDMIEFCGISERLPEARVRAFESLKRHVDSVAARSWLNTQILLPLVRQRIELALFDLSDDERKAGTKQLHAIRLETRRRNEIVVYVSEALQYLVYSLRPQMFDGEVRNTMKDFGYMKLSIVTIPSILPQKLRKTTPKHRKSQREDYPPGINLRPDIVDRAFELIGDSLSKPGVPILLKRLLDVAGSRPEIRDKAALWLNQNPDASHAAEIAASLLSAAPEANMAERISDWLNARPDIPGSQYVFAGLLAMPSKRTEFGQKAIRWIQRHRGSSDAGILLAKLLKELGPSEEVLALSVEWLRRHDNTPSSRDFLKRISVKLRKRIEAALAFN